MSKRFWLVVLLVVVLAAGALVALDFAIGGGQNFWGILEWVATKDLSVFNELFEKYYRAIEFTATLFIFPILHKILKNYRAHGNMIRRKLDNNTGIVIFGLFDGQIRSDMLDTMKSALLGDWLFELASSWNDEPSPNLITSKVDFEQAAIRHALRCAASGPIIRSRRIDCYFRNAIVGGTKNYPLARMVVALARPDANKLESDDYPRIVIIEVGHLERIHLAGDTVQPEYDTHEDRTWLETIRELGKLYFGPEGPEKKSFVVLDTPYTLAN